MFLGIAGSLRLTDDLCSNTFPEMSEKTMIEAPEIDAGNRETGNESFFNDKDYAVLERVESALANGIILKKWWEHTQANNSYTDAFEIVQDFNEPEEGFGFFDNVPMPQGDLPVMGTVDGSLYDYTKHSVVEDVRDEFREFVLRYFMRVSDYEEPSAYVPEGETRNKYVRGLSWCPQTINSDRGFGFTQLYYKLRETGEIGKFRRNESASIVDLREIGDKYEWIVLKVRIFNFNFKVPVPGTEQSQIVVPSDEESYLVVNRDFVVNEDDPEPDVLGRYGFGYAFIHSSETSVLAYGPGEFSAAIELISFKIHADGSIRVQLVFVVNRPNQILNVTIDPIDWSFRVADFFSLGLTKVISDPFRNIFQTLPFRLNGIDPVSAFVTISNGLTDGVAAEAFCISREQMEKDFLVQHYKQHYEMLVGSLLTWRRIPNWLDTASLPDWVIRGRMM